MANLDLFGTRRSTRSIVPVSGISVHHHQVTVLFSLALLLLFSSKQDAAVL